MKMVKMMIPIVALVILVSCGENKTKVENTKEVNTKVLTKEEQANLTPDQVIEILKKGNKEFVNDELTVRNNSELVRDAANGQFPKAVILSCLDSRVPVEDIFHRAIGDIFVARVAGNIVNTDILGSMEFACKASGAKLVMVLGHGACGAIKSAIDNVELGNITEMLSKIKPAVNETRAEFAGDARSSNIEFVDAVCIHNVALMIKEIRERSPILREMEENGAIKIIGGYYDMHTGKVDFYENM